MGAGLWFMIRVQMTSTPLNTIRMNPKNVSTESTESHGNMMLKFPWFVFFACFRCHTRLLWITWEYLYKTAGVTEQLILMILCVKGYGVVRLWHSFFIVYFIAELSICKDIALHWLVNVMGKMKNKRHPAPVTLFVWARWFKWSLQWHD